MFWLTVSLKLIKYTKIPKSSVFSPAEWILNCISLQTSSVLLRNLSRASHCYYILYRTKLVLLGKTEQHWRAKHTTAVQIRTEMLRRRKCLFFFGNIMFSVVVLACVIKLIFASVVTSLASSSSFLFVFHCTVSTHMCLRELTERLHCKPGVGWPTLPAGRCWLPGRSRCGNGRTSTTDRWRALPESETAGHCWQSPLSDGGGVKDQAVRGCIYIFT